MKYIFTLAFIFLFKLASADIIDDISVSFKNGNSKELAGNFASTLELSVLGQEDIYSSAQAELILRGFFQKNAPTAVKVVHKVVSNVNYKFGVIILSAQKNSFRISYELKNTGGKFLITQIRIEENKE